MRVPSCRRIPDGRPRTRCARSRQRYLQLVIERARNGGFDHLLEARADTGARHRVRIRCRPDLVARRGAETGDERIADQRDLDGAVGRRDTDVAGPEHPRRITLRRARMLDFRAVHLHVLIAARHDDRRRRDERGDDQRTRECVSWHLGPAGVLRLFQLQIQRADRQLRLETCNSVRRAVRRQPHLGLTILTEQTLRPDDWFQNDRVELAGRHLDPLATVDLDDHRILVGLIVAVEL